MSKITDVTTNPDTIMKSASNFILMKGIKKQGFNHDKKRGDIQLMVTIRIYLLQKIKSLLI
ncbi:MAG: hypothetical protein AAF039_00995 [Bacteroidota bacterium]